MEIPLDSPKNRDCPNQFLLGVNVCGLLNSNTGFICLFFICVNASGSFQVSVVLKFVFTVSAVFWFVFKQSCGKFCVQFQLCSNLTREKGTKQKWSENSRPPWTIFICLTICFLKKWISLSRIYQSWIVWLLCWFGWLKFWIGSGTIAQIPGIQCPILSVLTQCNLLVRTCLQQCI